MIKLTSLQGEEFYLNPDLIEKIQNSHDTIVTLVHGKRIRVREEGEDIRLKFIDYKKMIHGDMEVQK